MNERSISDDNGLSLREDVHGHERARRDGQFTNRYQNYTQGGVAATIDASYYKGPGARNGKEREFVAIESETQRPKRKYIVRRLTPLECCRLQGFPDCWLDGVDGSDSAKYKLWGNGIALPCAADVIGRIAKELNGTNEN